MIGNAELRGDDPRKPRPESPTEQLEAARGHVGVRDEQHAARRPLQLEQVRRADCAGVVGPEDKLLTAVGDPAGTTAAAAEVHEAVAANPPQHEEIGRPDRGCGGVRARG
ncbi:MAG: hypothetical protein H0X39_13340 [Actinobacteria bacterium]|nr:hypothetical protein [Actinomycetota bacterium]